VIPKGLVTLFFRGTVLPKPKNNLKLLLNASEASLVDLRTLQSKA